MNALEHQKHARTLAATNNAIDGLPQLDESHDIDGNRVGSVNEDVTYLVDVTGLLDGQAFDFGDIAEIASLAARRDATIDAGNTYSGGEYDRVSVGVDAGDVSETITMKCGRAIVAVSLKLTVDAFMSADVPAAAGHGRSR